jgi:hypothetical protein
MSKLSKRAKKRQQQNRKKRNEYIYGTTADIVSSIEITVDNQTGIISFGTSMVNCYSEVSYEREDGKEEKTINRVYQDDDLSFDGHNEIFDKYNRVIAIDTNQKHHNGVWIAATANIELKLIHTGGSEKWYQNFLMPSIISISGEKITEKEGWYNSLNILFAHNIINIDTKIALIIDSHLDEIGKINTQSIPLENNFYLPKNFKLFYASSDTGSEYTINKLIRVADMVSSQYINAIINNGKNLIAATLNDNKTRLYSVFSETNSAQHIIQQEEVVVRAIIRPIYETIYT